MAELNLSLRKENLLAVFEKMSFTGLICKGSIASQFNAGAIIMVVACLGTSDSRSSAETPKLDFSDVSCEGS